MLSAVVIGLTVYRPVEKDKEVVNLVDMLKLVEPYIKDSNGVITYYDEVKEGFSRKQTKKKSLPCLLIFEPTVLLSKVFIPIIILYL